MSVHQQATIEEKITKSAIQRVILEHMKPIRTILKTIAMP